MQQLHAKHQGKNNRLFKYNTVKCFSNFAFAFTLHWPYLFAYFIILLFFSVILFDNHIFSNQVEGERSRASCAAFYKMQKFVFYLN